jgi:hypothetical protein
MALNDGKSAYRILPHEIANLEGISKSRKEKIARLIYPVLEVALPLWNTEQLRDYVAPDVVTRTAIRYIQDFERIGRCDVDS